MRFSIHSMSVLAVGSAALGLTAAGVAAAPAMAGAPTPGQLAARGDTFIAVPSARVSSLQKLGKGKTRDVRIAGVGGVPGTGVSVKAKVKVAALRSGKAVVRPAGGGPKSKLALRAGSTAKLAVTAVPGANGSWTVKNKSAGKVRFTVTIKGYWVPAPAGGGVPAGPAAPGVPTQPPAPTQPTQPTQPPQPVIPASAPCAVSSAAPAWKHVVWILLENRGATQFGTSNSPYLNGVAAKCGSASNFSALGHPSAPNYIGLTSGSTGGLSSEVGPGKRLLPRDSIFSQLGAGGWKVYGESSTRNCQLNDTSLYAARHNPALYYANIQGQCANQVLPMNGTPDLSSKLTVILPNQLNNMHDTGVKYGDSWLAGFLPKLIATPQYQAGDTAIFVMSAESHMDQADNQVPLYVISPSTAAGSRSTTTANLYSVLRTTQEMLGLGRLLHSNEAPSLRAPFRL